MLRVCLTCALPIDAGCATVPHIVRLSASDLLRRCVTCALDVCRRVHAARQARGEPVRREQRAHLRAQAATAALAELSPHPAALDAPGNHVLPVASSAAAHEALRPATGDGVHDAAVGAQRGMAAAAAGAAVPGTHSPQEGGGMPAQHPRGGEDSMDEDEPLRSVCRHSSDAAGAPAPERPHHAAGAGTLGVEDRRLEHARPAAPAGGPPVEAAQTGQAPGPRGSAEPAWLQQRSPGAQQDGLPDENMQPQLQMPGKLHGSGSAHAEGLSQSALPA